MKFPVQVISSLSSSSCSKYLHIEDLDDDTTDMIGVIVDPKGSKKLLMKSDVSNIEEYTFSWDQCKIIGVDKPLDISSHYRIVPHVGFVNIVETDESYIHPAVHLIEEAMEEEEEEEDDNSDDGGTKVSDDLLLECLKTKRRRKRSSNKKIEKVQFGDVGVLKQKYGIEAAEKWMKYHGQDFVDIRHVRTVNSFVRQYYIMDEKKMKYIRVPNFTDCMNKVSQHVNRNFWNDMACTNQCQNYGLVFSEGSFVSNKAPRSAVACQASSSSNV